MQDQSHRRPELGDEQPPAHHREDVEMMHPVVHEDEEAEVEARDVVDDTTKTGEDLRVNDNTLEAMHLLRHHNLLLLKNPTLSRRMAGALLPNQPRRILVADPAQLRLER